ncbi:glycosyl hydrolase family protein [Actinomadura sp. KC345]|uniref:glycoside hydrolase family 16 protein n=1 Tax=Actinomadura sp. KC345 TaxID=2530371 RepID=UPI00104C24E1|nr:glycoside hydrolase family 16 protein [Actinomadura sp. KC345]TDC57510.1 glycosyl hydrolase family protein [Actinomadura sp. KC345]
MPYPPLRRRSRMPRKARRRTLVTAVCTAVLTTGPLTTGALLTTAASSPPPPPPGWSLVWSDDFDGAAGSPPSPQNWIIDTGHGYPGGPPNWGTGEIQRYTADPANVSLDGTGNLKITAIKGASGEWTSSRIETRRTDFKPAEGRVLRIEGRLQMPNVTEAEALGYWPAFWALGSPYRGDYQNWPSIGEFDIMENVNGINSVWGVLHCGTNPGGPCNETSGIGASRACPGSACQSAMHTYRFEWDRSVSPNRLRWYVDGEQYHRVGEDRIGAAAWNDMTGHGGYFLLLNLAMGGAFPNGVAGHATPTATTVSGRSMLVDHVAVWQSGATAGRR